MGKEFSGRNFTDCAMNGKVYIGKKNGQSRDLKAHLGHGMKNDAANFAAGKGTGCGNRRGWVCRHLRMVVFVVVLMCAFFLLDSLMLAVVHHIVPPRNGSGVSKSKGSQVRAMFIVLVCSPIIG